MEASSFLDEDQRVWCKNFGNPGSLLFPSLEDRRGDFIVKIISLTLTIVVMSFAAFAQNTQTAN